MIALVADKIDLPDGTYAGMWSAYAVRIDGHPGVHLETVEGVRSLDGTPVTVTVRDGRATVTEGGAL